MKHWNNCLSVLLAVVLLLPGQGVAAALEGDEITISTVQDLTEFSRSCSLDAWSRGKTVTLEADLDLTDTDFQPIPTFGGTFDGQGHTISGLSLEGSGDVQGLFRYLQEGGVVKDLTVKGTVSPEDFQNTVGGIVGENRGELLRCAFRGTVKGKNDVGGLVGINEVTGQVVCASFGGDVTGEKHVGGLVGQNLGSVVECINLGSVNTAASDNGVQQDWEEDDLEGHVTGWTDVGGVAGYSSGILQSCRNEGAVGYPHVGYNIGGIAGRQGGLLDGCTNSGSIQGRKDVGGVAGQLEPQVTLLYDKSFLQRLGEELDVLQGLTDRLLDDAGGVSHSVSDQMRELSDRTRTTRDSLTGLTDAVTEWADEGVGQINDLSARLSRALQQLQPILNDMEGTLEELEGVTDSLADTLDRAGKLGSLGGESLDELRSALEELDRMSDRLRQSVSNVRQAIKALGEALGDQEASQKAWENLNTAVQELVQVVPDGIHRVVNHLQESLDALEQTGDAADETREDLRNAANGLSSVVDRLAGSAGELSQVLEEFNRGDQIQFPGLSQQITAQRDALDQAVSGLMDSADNLNNLMEDSTQQLLDDLKAINAQFGAIHQVIREEGERAQEEEPGDRLEDVSDRLDAQAQTTGRVSNSRNLGQVEGDLNVAGVMGSMAVELDFDPEDDLTKEGERSTNVWVQAKAVSFGCINQGTVTGKKDYVGGVVGRMDLGRVDDCQGYGTVSSTDGSYVGGIAGASWGTIRGCWSRCTLSGTHYIGGVAGLGSTLYDCRTLVEITQGKAYLGAVAGDVEEDGTVEGNLFTSPDLAAIDGISYAGKAEPVDFETLCAQPGVPADFALLTLTFVADGHQVGVREVPYGEGLDSLPDIPAKEGCSAAWPELDYAHITASQTVEAVYTPYVSSLSEDGQLPEILVDGSFSSGAQVSHTTSEVGWTDEKGRGYQGTAWTVTVTDPVLEEVSCTIHYRLPQKGGRWTLWVQDEEGSWHIQSHKIDGQYLLLESGGGTTTFCVLPDHSLPVWAIALMALAGAGVLTGAVLVVRRRGRKGRAARQ